MLWYACLCLARYADGFLQLVADLKAHCACGRCERDCTTWQAFILHFVSGAKHVTLAFCQPLACEMSGRKGGRGRSEARTNGEENVEGERGANFQGPSRRSRKERKRERNKKEMKQTAGAEGAQFILTGRGGRERERKGEPVRSHAPRHRTRHDGNQDALAGNDEEKTQHGDSTQNYTMIPGLQSQKSHREGD